MQPFELKSTFTGIGGAKLPDRQCRRQRNRGHLGRQFRTPVGHQHGPFRRLRHPLYSAFQPGTDRDPDGDADFCDRSAGAVAPFPSLRPGLLLVAGFAGLGFTGLVTLAAEGCGRCEDRRLLVTA